MTHILLRGSNMTNRLIAAAVVTSLSTLSFSLPAHALTSKECSAKFKAAQSAGTTGNLKYADYRKAECGTGASATPAAKPAATPAAAPAATPTTKPIVAAKPAPAPARAPAAPAAAKPETASDAVFPTAISTKYSTEKAGMQRMHTCLDQYNANKTTNANGGMKWTQKGGGYYSECAKRLKG